MIFVLCSSQIREMALRVDICVVLFVMVFGCMQVLSSNTTTSFTTITKNGANQNGNGANQNTNNDSSTITSTITSTSTNGIMKNTTPSSSNNNTNQNAKPNVSALVGCSSGSSASFMISSFKLLLLAFVTLSFLQMIQ